MFTQTIALQCIALLTSPKECCAPVFGRIVPTKTGAYFQKSFGISYSTIRDEFKKYISPFVNDFGDFSLHSPKSGGAYNDGYKLSDP